MTTNPVEFSADRLVLGTAQFGLPYGIANARGQISQDEVRRLLCVAWEEGVRTLDTAIAYGTSEAVLGEALGPEPGLGFRVVTKVPKGTSGSDVAYLLDGSRARLRRPLLDAVLAHDASALLTDPNLLEALTEAKESGGVGAVGASFYCVEDLERLLDANVPLDLVQLPFSVLDQRFRRVLPRLAETGIEVHVRSVFLQGLLLLEPAALKPYFGSVAPIIRRLRELAEEAGLALPALLLSYALMVPGIDRVVIGVDGVDNLREDLRALGGRDQVRPLLGVLDGLASTDEDMLLPTRWPS